MGNNSSVSNHHAKILSVLNTNSRSSAVAKKLPPTTRQFSKKSSLKRPCQDAFVTPTSSERSSSHERVSQTSSMKVHWSEEPDDVVEVKVQGRMLSIAKQMKQLKLLKQQRNRRTCVTPMFVDIVPDAQSWTSDGQAYIHRLELNLESQFDDGSPQRSLYDSEVGQFPCEPAPSGTALGYPWEGDWEEQAMRSQIKCDSDSTKLVQREHWASEGKERQLFRTQVWPVSL